MLMRLSAWPQRPRLNARSPRWSRSVLGSSPSSHPVRRPQLAPRERRLPSEAWARLPGFWTGLMAASMCSFDLRSPATAAHASLVTVALAVSCSSRSVPWSSTGGSLSRSHGHDGFHESLSIGEFKMEPMLDIDRSFGGIRTGRIPATTSTFSGSGVGNAISACGMPPEASIVAECCRKAREIRGPRDGWAERSRSG